MSERRYASPTAFNTAITTRAKLAAEEDALERGLIGRDADNFIGRRVNQ